MYKRNEIVYKYLLAGEKFMSEMHLRRPWFTYSACGPFTKNNERIQKLKKTGDLWYIYQNKLDNSCFQHDLTYGDFKNLTRWADEISCDKVFNIAKKPKYDGYQRRLASLVYNFFDKKFSGSGIKNEMISHKNSVGELHKPSIRKFNKRKVQSNFYRQYLGILI